MAYEMLDYCEAQVAIRLILDVYYLLSPPMRLDAKEDEDASESLLDVSPEDYLEDAATPEEALFDLLADLVGLYEDKYDSPDLMLNRATRQRVESALEREIDYQRIPDGNPEKLSLVDLHIRVTPMMASLLSFIAGLEGILWLDVSIAIDRLVQGLRQEYDVWSTVEPAYFGGVADDRDRLISRIVDLETFNHLLHHLQVSQIRHRDDIVRWRGDNYDSGN
jgi:hypothetical protein